MKTSLLAGLLCLLVVSASDAAAKSYGGSTTAAVLRLSPSAAATALGDAGVTRGDLSALHYNPAGLAGVERSEIAFMYNALVLDISQGSIGYGRKLGPGSMGLLVSYTDYGQTVKTVYSGVGGASAGTFSGHDIVTALGYGAPVGHNFSAGAAMKVFSSSIDGSSASAVAGDVGVQWHRAGTRGIDPAFGVSVLNLGGKATYDRVAEKLPTSIRFGGAVGFMKNRVRVMADADKVFDGGWGWHAGLEIRPIRVLALRAGYNSTAEAGSGVTAGAGINVSGMIVDYAWTHFGDFGATHRVGLTYRF